LPSEPGTAQLVLSEQSNNSGRQFMLSVYIENIGEMTVIECEGRIVRSDAAFKLREAVRSQRRARIIVLDLSELLTIEGEGLGMLVSLQRWAYDRGIRLKLFNPRQTVRERLAHTKSMPEFDIATLEEMMAILVWANHQYRHAA
jgi:anti-anti-sigma regulatory factor